MPITLTSTSFLPTILQPPPPIFASESIRMGNTAKHFQINACNPAEHEYESAHDAPCSPQLAYPSEQFTPVKLPNVNIWTEYEQEVDRLRQFLENQEDSKQHMIMVDAIQRAGVDEHYGKQIDAILNKHYLETRDGAQKCDSLRHLSLSFRLLRRQGYNIPADVFINFKGENGRFKGDLRQDIRGLLELYEAAQLSFEGESILDEAEEFSSRVLHEYCSSDHKDHIWTNNIRTTLRHPTHRSIIRLAHRSNLEGTTGTKSQWERALRRLVEMDIRMQESLFRDELYQFSKWWNTLGVVRELQLARNQPPKWYTWSIAMLNGSISLSEARVQLTKSIAFIYLIDDIFNLFGTPKELAIFTEAIEKWDHDAIATLPDYMKMCYKALLDMTTDMGYVIYKKYRHNPINHLKQTWANLCNAFLAEAKWFASSNFPKAEEYLDNGKVSSGVHVVLVHLYFLLGFGGANESEIPLSDTSTLISCVATILRLWDDLGSAKDEHQDGKDGSYIACYMKDNQHSSYKQAREHVMKMIAREWKRLNKECFSLYNPSTSSFLEASLNLARMVPLMYDYDNNQQLPVLDEYVSYMFCQPNILGAQSHKKEENSSLNSVTETNVT